MDALVQIHILDKLTDLMISLRKVTVFRQLDLLFLDRLTGAIVVQHGKGDKRAAQAGVTTPGLHDFRRCFAVTCLRSGMDLVTLSRLLGHSSVAVIQKY